MKVFFYDHAFHKKTASSRFFVELLSGAFEVEQIFLEPEANHRRIDFGAIGTDDVVVLWQMDFLAPLFLALGLKVVVIPMFDGSSAAPDLHWLFARHAAFINFSLALHNRVEAMGGRSTLVRYYPEPTPLPPVEAPGEVRAFFWRRRPEDGIDLELVDRLVGQEAASIHIHDAPDDPTQTRSALATPHGRTYRLTRSTWFEREDDYLAALSKANVFIAPRNGEGIGMAMLAALARGMTVVASDVPTHNEYIADGLNGFLFDLEAPRPIPLKERLDAVSRMAWRTARFGRDVWLAATPALVQTLRDLTAPKATLTRAEVEALAPRLIRAYYGGMDSYGGFLMGIAPLIARVSGAALAGRLSTSGRYDDRVPTDPLDRRPDWLPQNRLPTTEPDAFVLSGRLAGREDGAWIIGDGTVLGFAIDPRFGAVQKGHLTLRRHDAVDEEVGYFIVLNGRTVAAGRIAGDQPTVEIPIDPADLKFQNRLQIQSQGTTWGMAAGHISRLAVAALVFST